MFNPEKLLGQMLMNGVSGSGRKRSRRRRRARGLGGSVRQAAFSTGGLTLLGGVAFAAFEHLRDKSQASAAGQSNATVLPDAPAGPGGSAAGATGIPLPPIPGGSPSAPGLPRADGPARPDLPPLPVHPSGGATASAGEPLASASASTSEDAMLLIEAMVAAAKADGHVDDEERARILAELDESGASQADRRALESMLDAPLDLDGLAQRATSAGRASEVYAASLLVTDADDAAEQGYLAMLAARLGLSRELVAQLQEQIDAATEEVDDDESGGSGEGAGSGGSGGGRA